ncbi:class I SAM-dependent methyltransferase [Ectobacillus ponti]|uniref:Class I SAM-dependent methyltransferase n=1 Tax=Ectobacillus ponti TaxID=2961894 RepID=A0AA41XBN7_9BACI|nr:class I SAM-dependent methyltransferase [Ectobacillus ponti]MCP8970698.1 class I SAM-dependent methyltransferase [Ectobacillus ponti]
MDVKKQVQTQFGKHAQNYVTSPGHAKGNDLAALAAMADAVQEDVLLDIATGGGHVANAFAPLVKEVTALDLTPDMLNTAERFIQGNGHTNVTFVQGDAEQLPFAANTFTKVTCRIAPHHFPDITAFVQESFRVLQPGGMFLMIDNVAPEADDLDIFYNTVEQKRDPSHVRACKKSEWLRYTETAGFAIRHLTTFSKTFVFEAWCRMMSVPPAVQEELQSFMLTAPAHIQQHFQLQMQNGSLYSFQGQSMLLICQKPE